MTRAPRQRFDTIELARAFAAILVVFYHASRTAAEPRFWGTMAFGGYIGNFNVGVDFFFVLSGFIITWVHHQDIGQPGRLGRYARRRFLRIFPPYWAIMIPLAILYATHPGTGQPSDHDPLNVLRSVVLWPSSVQPVLGVAWTLTYEMFFYVLFGCLIVAGRWAMWLLPAWALAILVAQLWAPLAFPIGFILSPYNLEFLAGIACALLLHDRPAVPSPWQVPIGALAFGVALFMPHVQDPPIVGRLVFGACSVVILTGMVGAQARGRISLPQPLLLLGAASYAIYLIHPVAISFLCQLVIRLGGRHLSADVAVIALSLLAIGVGLIFHLLVEKRAMALVAWCLDYRPFRGPDIPAPREN